MTREDVHIIVQCCCLVMFILNGGDEKQWARSLVRLPLWSSGADGCSISSVLVVHLAARRIRSWPCFEAFGSLQKGKFPTVRGLHRHSKTADSRKLHILFMATVAAINAFQRSWNGGHFWCVYDLLLVSEAMVAFIWRLYYLLSMAH